MVSCEPTTPTDPDEGGAGHGWDLAVLGMEHDVVRGACAELLRSVVEPEERYEVQPAVGLAEARYAASPRLLDAVRWATGSWRTSGIS